MMNWKLNQRSASQYRLQIIIFFFTMGGSRDTSAIILALLFNLTSWIRYDVTRRTNTIESNTSTGAD